MLDVLIYAYLFAGIITFTSEFLDALRLSDNTYPIAMGFFAIVCALFWPIYWAVRWRRNDI